MVHIDKILTGHEWAIREPDLKIWDSSPYETLQKKRNLSPNELSIFWQDT